MSAIYPMHNGPVIPRPKSVSMPTFLGVLAISVSLGGLVAWSCLSSIASATIVSGSVVVDGGRKYVQHLTGGVIKAINVREGQEVALGSTLVVLDATALNTTLLPLQRLLAMNMGAAARLQAEAEGLDHIATPPRGSDVGDDLMKEVLADERHLFQARGLSLRTRLDDLRSDGAEALVVAATISDQLGYEQIKIDLMQQDLAVSLELARSGLATTQRLRDVQRGLAELRSDSVSLISRRDDSLQNHRRDALQEREEVAKFVESARVDLQQVKRDQAEILLKLRGIQQQIAALSIRAPVSGRVVNLQIHTLGGVLSAGTTMLEIVPDGDPLVVEAEVRPDDITNVRLGSIVDVRLAGLGSQQLPKLLGRVSLVSADRLEDPARGVSFFRIRAEVAQDVLARISAYDFRVGMAVTLMIRKGEQSPIVYLTAPIADFFVRSPH